ncbi:MAG: HEAT repeat domain-containing protein [Bacteroidota bacterium]
MTRDSFSEHIPEYLDDMLSPEKRNEFEAYLKTCSDCEKELEEMRILFGAIAAEKVVVPSGNLKSAFLKDLEEAKAEEAVKIIPLAQNKEKSNWASNLLKVAASVALLVASFQMGGFFEKEKSNQSLETLQNESLVMKQQVMLSLMENQSASKRIQGVNYIEEIPNPDEAIVAALSQRMLNDENDNVRLTALEALARFAANDAVKDVFIKALEKEKNPSIQILIIDILVSIQEKRAVAPMQKLLEQEDTQPFIKKQIQTGLPKII